MLETFTKNYQQDMNKVQVQIGQLANSVNERQKGILPSQQLPNPKHHFPLHEVEDTGPSQCHAIIP